MADAPLDVRIALLGPLAVEVGGTAVDIPAGHQRRLLAALAIDAGRIVSTDRLVDLLWADDPPPSARNSLQSHLARLRRALGGAETVQRDPPGYRLAVAAEDVDVLRFEQLVDEAVRTTEPAPRRDLLDRAMALWRAEEASVLDANGLAQDAERLVRRRLDAQVDRATGALSGGDLPTAEADARSVLRTDPLHEPAVVLLVRVLAATGRTAEADATVQDLRARLADQLGLDPSPALDEVHTALLRGQLPQVPAVVAPPAAPHVAPSPERPARTRSGPTTRPALPRSSFLGRREALDGLGAAVASQRCVTVVGPGGVGKTRLALELAHGQRGDVVWADLLDARTRADVVGRLALATGCGTPTDLVTLSPLAEAVTDALVVLDNCEQAVNEVAAVVDALLHANPTTTVLATSRTPLGVDDEHVVDLAPLPTTSPDDLQRSLALTLFADRLGRDVDLDDPDRRRTAAEVVVALDGLPLALELAARQARNLGLDAVRDRLDDRLELLGAPRPVGHPAHADLRSLVRWSTDQLDEPDRRAFRWLSVFASPFTLTQAEELLGPDGADIGAVAARIGRLVEQSLVARRAPDRFMLLETLRVCGGEELDERAEADAARARHTELVLAEAEAADSRIGTPDDVAAVSTMNALVADLQAVTDRLVDQQDVEGLCRLARAARQYAYETQRPELLRSARVALDLLAVGEGTAVSRELRDGAVVAAAIEAATQGDLERARRLVHPMLAEHPSTAVAAVAWSVVGDTGLWQVEAGALAAYRKAIQLSEAAGDQVLAVSGWVGVALAHAYRGDGAEARRAVDEVDRRTERLRSPLLSAWAAYARAEAEANHDPEAALRAYELAIEQGRPVDAHLLVTAASSGAAAVRARHGDPVVVLHHVRDTLRDLRRWGNTHLQENVLRNVAVLLTRMGSDEVAAVLLGATTSTDLYEAERRRVDTAAAALTERLGERESVRRRADGARMEPAELLAIALSAVEELVDD